VAKTKQKKIHRFKLEKVGTTKSQIRHYIIKSSLTSSLKLANCYFLKHKYEEYEENNNSE
jgi:hypothetical protein